MPIFDTAVVLVVCMCLCNLWARVVGNDWTTFFGKGLGGAESECSVCSALVGKGKKLKYIRQSFLGAIGESGGRERLYSATVIFGGGKEDRVATSATLEPSRTLLGIQWAAKPPLQLMNNSIQ